MIGFGASGFGRTPISKGLLMLTVAASLLFGITSNKRLSLSQSFHVWHLLILPFTFSSVPELLFGALILYSFRTFERVFGSRKFASLAVFLIGSSSIVQLLTCGLAGDGRPVLASGPYAFIFGLYVYFFSIIPSVSSVKILGFQLGEKLVMYALGTQLALLNLPTSLSASLMGVVLGLAHITTCLPFQKLLVPAPVADFCDRVFGPWLASSALENGGAHRAARASPDSGGPYQEDRGQFLPPNENDVTVLVGMGFSEDAVRRALAETHNDVHRATDILLEGSR